MSVFSERSRFRFFEAILCLRAGSWNDNFKTTDPNPWWLHICVTKQSQNLAWLKGLLIRVYGWEPNTGKIVFCFTTVENDWHTDHTEQLCSHNLDSEQIGWRKCPVARKSFESQGRRWNFLAHTINPPFPIVQICI